MTAANGKVVSKRRTGRPTIYSEKLVIEMCKQIARGKSVRTLTGQADMPSESTFYDWLLNKPEFREMYDQAKQLQAEIRADEILEIVDNCPLDKDEIQRARLRVDAIKWVAARLLPHRYGDRLAAVTVDDLPKLTININVSSDDEA